MGVNQWSLLYKTMRLWKYLLLGWSLWEQIFKERTLIWGWLPINKRTITNKTWNLTLNNNTTNSNFQTIASNKIHSSWLMSCFSTTKATNQQNLLSCWCDFSNHEQKKHIYIINIMIFFFHSIFNKSHLFLPSLLKSFDIKEFLCYLTLFLLEFLTLFP